MVPMAKRVNILAGAVAYGGDPRDVEAGAGPEEHRRGQRPEQEGVVFQRHQARDPRKAGERSQEKQYRAESGEDQPIAEYPGLFDPGQPL